MIDHNLKLIHNFIFRMLDLFRRGSTITALFERVVILKSTWWHMGMQNVHAVFESCCFTTVTLVLGVSTMHVCDCNDCVSTYVCIYKHMYTHLYTHTYVSIYIYTFD